jgi:hypothetical protein
MLRSPCADKTWLAAVNQHLSAPVNIAALEEEAPMLRYARPHPLCAFLRGAETVTPDEFDEYRSELRHSAEQAPGPYSRSGSTDCPIRREADKLRQRAHSCRETAKEYSANTAAPLLKRAEELEGEADWLESRVLGLGAELGMGTA